jgi:ribosome maturation factor RimP
MAKRQESERRDARNARRDKQPGPPPEPTPEIEAAIHRDAKLGDLEIVSYSFRGRRLEITVDREAGVSVENCTWLSRAIQETLEGMGLDPGALDLVVASPGLDRRLRHGRDFTRFAGKQVTVALAEKRDGRRRYRGTLLDGTDERLKILLDDESELEIALGDVDEVRLVPEI